LLITRRGLSNKQTIERAKGKERRSIDERANVRTNDAAAVLPAPSKKRSSDSRARPGESAAIEKKPRDRERHADNDAKDRRRQRLPRGTARSEWKKTLPATRPRRADDEKAVARGDETREAHERTEPPPNEGSRR
jgi:hypothetical protein